MKRCYYTKISNIPNDKKEEWLKDFNTPFSRKEYDSIYFAIETAYSHILGKLKENDELYWSIVTHYKLIMMLANDYFNYKTLIALDKLGYSTIDDNRTIKEEMEIIFNDSGLNFLEIKHLPLKSKIKEKLRRFKQHFLAFGLNNILNFDSYLVGDSNSFIMNKYVKEHSIHPKIMRAMECLPCDFNSHLSKKITNKTRKIILSFFDELLYDNNATSFFSNTIVQEKLINTIASTALTIAYVRKSLPKRLYPLLVDSIHNKYSRIIMSAWKMNGGETIGFTHGNACLHPFLISTCKYIFKPLSKYIIDSYGEYITFEKYKKSDYLPYSLELIMQQNGCLNNLSHQENVDRRVIKKILIVGFPIGYERQYLLLNHTGLNYAHFTIRICRALQALGYKVLYKAHPDTLNESNLFFNDYVDEVIEENFETVVEGSDCVFYISPYTTTFPISIAYHIPVVYTNNKDWNLWNPEIKEQLDKCAVPLEIYSDKNGILQFDKKELSEAIKESKNRKSYAGVEHFF